MGRGWKWGGDKRRRTWDSSVYFFDVCSVQILGFCRQKNKCKRLFLKTYKKKLLHTCVSEETTIPIHQERRLFGGVGVRRRQGSSSN